MYREVLSQILVLLILTFNGPTWAEAQGQNSARADELRNQTLSCLHAICGENQGLDLSQYRRQPELTRRLYKILEDYATVTHDSESLKSLEEAKPLPDYTLDANLSDLGSTLQVFDAFTGFLNVLPKSRASLPDLLLKTRSLSLLYPQILGVQSQELSELLANHLEISQRPTQDEALKEIRSNLSALENWKGEKALESLPILFAVLDSIQIMAPYSDGKVADKDNAFQLCPATMNSSRTLSIALHETMHIISRHAAKDKKSALFFAIMKLKERLTALNPLHDPRFAEEDLADYFSARLSGENMACEFVSLAKKSGNLGMIQKDPLDNHSAVVYRVLAIHTATHGSLPDACSSLKSRTTEASLITK